MEKEFRYVEPFFLEDEVFLYNPFTMERAIIAYSDYLKLEQKDLPDILTTKSKAFEVPNKKLVPSHIKVMYLIVTDACNFACKYCFIEEAFKQYPTNFMSQQTMEKAVNFFIDKCKAKDKNITFYGGEPLLNKNIVSNTLDILSNQYEKIDTSIITNGVLIDDDIAKKLSEHKVSVSVSIDGKKESHDAMRIYRNGKPTFNDVITGWKKLQNAGIKPSASFTIGSHNINNLEENVEWVCTNLEPPAIGFNMPNTIPVKGNPAQISPTLVAKKMIKCYEILRRYNVYEDRVYGRRIMPFVQKQFYLKDCCGCGEQITVSPDGMWGPCHGFLSSKKDFVNIEPRTEEELLKNKIWQEWNNRCPFNTDKCHNCAAIGICGGGCPYYSCIEHGNMWAQDERICALCDMTLAYIIRETYSKIKDKKINMIIRRPMHGDKERFMEFVEKLKLEKIQDVEKLESWFPVGMLNLINENKASCFFAEENMDIIAFCNAIYDKSTATIGIYLLKEYRGKGIAQKLYKLIEDECKTNSITKLIANVNFENEQSKKFFEKLGFKISGKDKSDFILTKNIS